MTRTVFLAGEPDADALLAADPLALLIGMLLDQQVPMETAFLGPKRLADRLGGLDVRDVAARDPEEFAALCATPPAVHRFHGAMAGRIQALCGAVVGSWDGRAEAIWTDGSPTGAEVLTRLRALPGFGEQKARIFLALLGKQFDLAADGWREAAGDYGTEGSHRSVADVVDLDSRHAVRAFKRQMKAAAAAERG